MSYYCPRDRTKLTGLDFALTGRWACRACYGTIAFEKQIHNHPSGTGFLITLHQITSKPSNLKCPACSKQMLKAHTNFNVLKVEMDRCDDCRLIWFDPREVRSIKGKKDLQPEIGASIVDQQMFAREQEFFRTFVEIWSDMDSRLQLRFVRRNEVALLLIRVALPVICLFLLLRTINANYNYAPRTGDVFGIYKSAPWKHAIKALAASILFSWRPNWFWPVLFLLFFWIFATMAVLKAS